MTRVDRFAFFHTSALVAAMTAVGPVAAAPMTDTRVVALAGDAAPDGNGTFSSFARPALNNTGETAFFADLTGTANGSADNSGIFRGDGSAGPVQIAREGDTAPSGSGSFSGFNNSPALNDAGQAAFLASFTDGTGLFLGDGAAAPVQIVGGGDTAPSGNGRIGLFVDTAALNDAGQATFGAFLFDTAEGFGDDFGVFRGDSSVGTVQISREGDAAPDGNGSFSGFSSAALNNAGQAAFRASLTGTAEGSADNDGVFRGDGLTTPVQIARAGEAAPDGNGSFSSFGFTVALNDAGQAAFNANLTGTAGGSVDNSGIFRGDGAAGPVQISRGGDTAPDGNGTFSDFNNPALNDAGQAAFAASLTGTAGGSADDRGVFRGDGLTAPVQIAREGDAAPDGNGSFWFFSDPALNDAGQVAFSAFLTGTAGGSDDDRGLYLYDDLLGLLRVARKGDAFLGSTITGLGFNSGFHQQDEGSGLNNLGQVAFEFDLADGRSGIALWTIPEPNSLALLGLGSLTLLSHRRTSS